MNYTSEFIQRLYSEEGKNEFNCRMNVLGHMQQVPTHTHIDYKYFWSINQGALDD